MPDRSPTRAAIAIVGTLDTKGEELRFVRDQIQSVGLGTVVVDAGVLDEPVFSPDVSRQAVAAAAGEDFSALVAARDRGRSVQIMATGAAAVVCRLLENKAIAGIISLGGSAGTTIGCTAMRALPVGFPKVMVSTLASGDTRPYVGTKDICMMYSVLDIAGLNTVARRILSNAAAAICGMVAQSEAQGPGQRPVVAATMFGVTTPCVTMARRVLEENGYEVLVFHATGTGGQAMEALIGDGLVQGVLDITTTELADEVAGGVMSAGPERLKAAGIRGIPQVVCPGAIDMVNFGPMETVPGKYRDRQLHAHNPTVTLMRTTADECAGIGRITAEKLNCARGPATVLIPLRGVSAMDREGAPFYSPEALNAWKSGLKNGLAPHVRVIELDAHINDEVFAETAARLMLEAL